MSSPWALLSPSHSLSCALVMCKLLCPTCFVLRVFLFLCLCLFVFRTGSNVVQAGFELIYPRITLNFWFSVFQAWVSAVIDYRYTPLRVHPPPHVKRCSFFLLGDPFFEQWQVRNSKGEDLLTQTCECRSLAVPPIFGFVQGQVAAKCTVKLISELWERGCRVRISPSHHMHSSLRKRL